MNARPLSFKHAQRGAAAVEFAFVAAILFALLFVILEFGRLFFAINSVQEVTRRAAREQVVNWVSASAAVQRVAVLHSSANIGTGTLNFPKAGGTATVNFPGVGDVHNTDVRLSFYNTYANAVAGTSPISGISSSQVNFNNCLTGEINCINYVRASLTKSDGITPLDFNVIAPYMPANKFALPRSTVIMPAEALGLL